ncbi:SCO family protein [Pseudochelatococcus contaminans]|uniref:Protein SCO1/2 n=1 Tax=Pseudochelatococcus contaminans TaxID=1538103 RepID=A0A7W5Z804_9HYPH|nr:SCO family protein [Pseudochelatococcus contaminans]MBB3811344.1 protein SCO1/2 [Pseudochelatococcus contaminans]
MAATGLRRYLPFVVFLAGLIVLGGAIMLRLSGVSTPPEQSPIGGPFTLTDYNGHSFTEKDLVGGPTLIFFGFTHCPDICPSTLFDASEVLRVAGDNADKVKMLFVSVDPERDTAEVMKEYLGSFDERIKGLIGTPEQIETITKAYRAYYRKVPTGENPEDYTMDHTAIIYMLDKRGRFVNAFNLKRPPEEAARELLRYL